MKFWGQLLYKIFERLHSFSLPKLILQHMHAILKRAQWEGDLSSKKEEPISSSVFKA